MEKPNCFVCQIDLNLGEKLREDLLAQGFTLSIPPNTLFLAKKEGISCTLYHSGKMTVQGKGKDDFITYYLEPEILKSFAYSYPVQESDFAPHIGVDEAGKGDFFGPLCIAAVYADQAMIEKLLSFGIKDSKKITDAKIHVMSKKIKELCPHAIVMLYPKRYNELYESFKNLNSLLAWGHATAIAEVSTKTQCKEVLVDQFANERVLLNALKQKKTEVHLSQRPRAEEDPVVASASILARSAFLNGLQTLGDKIDTVLPKGANSGVIQIGKSLLAKHGIEIFSSIGKLHFKTYQDIVG
jgi:ribonuclease HIII